MPRASAAIAAFAAYAAAAVLATWPLAADPDASLLFSARRFDGYGVLWFGEHAWRVVTRGEPLWTSDTVAWPRGLDLRLADSFLFGLLYLPFRAVFSPVVAFNVFCLAAMVATAMGGWALGRALGGGPIAATACGFLLGFNSLMHDYRLEGEAYLLFGAPLPLFAAALARTMRGGGPGAGALAGALFGVLAWSSGYYAIDAAIVGAVLGAGLLVAGARPSPKALAAFVGVALLTAGPMATLVLGARPEDVLAARFPAGEDPLANVAKDAVSLTGMLVPLPGSAPFRAERTTYLGMAALALAGGACVVRGWRTTLPWALVAVAGAALALGPVLKVSDADVAGAAMPYTWLARATSAVLAYRMPVRFFAVAYVGLGALAALCLEGLAREGLAAWRRLALVGVVAVDGLLFSGAAVDRTAAPAQVPSGYAKLSGEGAVLDLFGHDRLLLRYAGRSVFYQVAHGQPTLANFTRAGDLQGEAGRRLAVALANGDLDAARSIAGVLADAGVTDLALHPASFPDSDVASIRAGLDAIAVAVPAEPPAAPEDDPVELWRLPAATGPREAAIATLEGWG
ncbi:MAG: hypothetical protein ACOZNI_25210 [Myxococcota bacterium]